jgi:hypothetical protein
MKDLNLTVLFVDTISARIYLALLKKHGYRPNKILFLKIESTSRKYRLLKKFFGQFVAISAQRLFRKKTAATAFSYLSKRLLKEHGLTPECLQADLSSYAESPVEKILVNGLDDERLVKHLAKSQEPRAKSQEPRIKNQESRIKNLPIYWWWFAERAVAFIGWAEVLAHSPWNRARRERRGLFFLVTAA